MVNKVVLNGRLTKEADLRFTSTGKAVATFILAVERNFTNGEGEHDTDFIRCVIWEKKAENFAEQTYKGSLVSVTGRIQTRNFENQEGQKIYVSEIVTGSYQLLEPKKVTEERRAKARK